MRRGTKAASTTAVLSVAFAVGVSACSAQSLRSDSRLLSAIQQEHICTDTPRFPIRAEPRLMQYGCSFALAALSEIASGNARSLGVEPADTARVEQVGIAEFTFRDLQGRIVEAYWSIGVSIRGFDFAVGLDIDRRTGRRKVRKVERPF